MDGTGELFKDFVDALPDSFETLTVRYPTNQYLSYPEFVNILRATCPSTEPFVLVAESFSTPLAIKYAATHPASLRGLVLCAGFVTSPVQGVQRSLGLLLTPILFRVKLPDFAARFLLVGRDAPHSLLATVRAAISSVQPKVLAARVRAALACDARPELDQVAAPILYLQAKQDRLVSLSCLEEIQEIKPEMTVAAIEGPHLLLQRAPQRTAEIIVAFVRQLP